MDDIVQLGLNRSAPSHSELLTPWSLPMAHNGVNNFWYLNGHSEEVIVFVHGIFSDSRSCWLYEDKNSGRRIFWPDLVRTDPRFKNPSIFLAGFDTQINSGDFALGECSAQVFDALERHSIDGTRPVLQHASIIFVCHSTGGIVARYLIERHQELFREKAIGLALLASPSLGSRWANFLSIFARLFNQRMGLQLRRGSEVLDELDGRFRDLVNRKAKLMPRLFGMEACEHKLVFRRWLFFFFPNRGKVVSKISAGCYFGRVTEIPGTDHFSIVKPDGFNHPSHEFLVTFHDRFTIFLSENGYAQKQTETSSQIREFLGSETPDGVAVVIRRSLITAQSIQDLQVCRAQVIATLQKYPDNEELILLRDQIEDALSREKAMKHGTTRLRLISSGSALVLLIGFISFFIGKRPDVVITSISQGASVSGESDAIVSGKLSHASANSSVYVLYKSAPDTWTASKARVSANGSWVANLGHWNDVTNEGGSNIAELSVLVTPVPLEEQHIGTAGEGVFLIPRDQLQKIAGQQSKSLVVGVKPIVVGETLRMDSPVAGSVVQMGEPLEVSGVISGKHDCVYVLHRTPDADVWAAHPANVDSSGRWELELRTESHRWIHLGVNEIIAISMRPEYCTGEHLYIRNGDIERRSLSKSPIVRIIVRERTD